MVHVAVAESAKTVGQVDGKDLEQGIEASKETSQIRQSIQESLRNGMGQTISQGSRTPLDKVTESKVTSEVPQRFLENILQGKKQPGTRENQGPSI